MANRASEPILRVGFLGGGNINAVLRRQVELARPYRIVGTFGRDDALPDAADVDVVVEAATQAAVRERVPGLLDAGVDVIVLSLGALADESVRDRLLGQPNAALNAAGGRRRGELIACSGAVGGLDHVRALRAAGPLTAVSLESRKLPATLVQPWMGRELREVLRAGEREVVLAEGRAADVAQQFPASANVAAALALAADAWDLATARVVADPSAVRTRHEVRAVGAAGEVCCVVSNEPSVDQPRSSAVVAWAALRSLDTYAQVRGFSSAGVSLFL